MVVRQVFTPKNVYDIKFDFVSKNKKIDYYQSSLKLRRIANQKYHLGRILEVSSASETQLGKNLSAFNLKLKTNKGRYYTVEQLFQSSKVFKNAGQQIQLLNCPSKEAKNKTRKLHEKDELIGFKLFGKDFPMQPTNLFYDWIYLHALATSDLKNEVLKFDAFTDIRFNSKHAINCQAMSCAKFKYLVENNNVKILNNLNDFIEFEKNWYKLNKD